VRFASETKTSPSKRGDLNGERMSGGGTGPTKNSCMLNLVQDCHFSLPWMSSSVALEEMSLCLENTFSYCPHRTIL
jgi:hypothetical protein